MKVRVASAGTGKTTSLVLRYLQLIAQGTPLRRIAGVTFTRSAADELRQRVGLGIRELLTEGSYLHVALLEAKRPLFEEALRELDGATLTTIHGFMIETLRLCAPMLSLDPAFSVLGEWEAQALFEEELKSLFYLASDAQHGLYGAKEELGEEAEGLLLQLFRSRSLSERFYADDFPKNIALERLFDAAYKKFEIRLGASLLPPSEIERKALMLARSKRALERLGGRFRIILVDEYQDVNPLQGAYFEALEHSGISTEVVGDPKQSIYGFRNADVNVFRRALHTGEVLTPLTDTRRHARVISRFLNHMTSTLGKAQMGFSLEEAPPVNTKGQQEETSGRIELHWVNGEAPIAKLREHEAKLLAERLKCNHEQYQIPYSQMAVLARSYAGLQQVEEALLAENLPYVLLQGRGYYERIEVRDLYHALRVGIDASGLSLAAWLRGPYAQLPFHEVDSILRADDPVEMLKSLNQEVYERLELTQAQVRGTPLNALKFLIRTPFIAQKRYVDFLDTRARENVDALLFTVAGQPPGDLELLLDRLDTLSRQTDAGDVPQSGEGIQLLTVHRSKGLEWPLVAVFDLGRMNYHQPQPLYLHPTTNHIVHRDSPRFAETRELLKKREDEESYRLLYVAASRARDTLIMTGSVKGQKVDGWMTAMSAMNLDHTTQSYSRPDFILQTHAYQEVNRHLKTEQQRKGLEPAAYIDQRFYPLEYPPVTSPSRIKQESFDDYEPLPFSDPEEGERLPGRATTVGTLTHYAISQNWSADNPTHIENLRAQEVMFPFTLDEQSDILTEVKMLLSNYEGILGNGIPHPQDRSEDYPELPMALPVGDTVFQGIIDRLYCADGVWYLEDYKTDQEITPEKYHFQLAVYLKAIQEVKGLTPQVQLVFLRFKEIVRIELDTLLKALAKEIQF
ncbi:MAG: UvrD-helicase domain-containing protein [Trueperaceae bacterium]|nr:UvrD-helicase domain-containing protein [Trueperaceae bacterium]